MLATETTPEDYLHQTFFSRADVQTLIENVTVIDGNCPVDNSFDYYIEAGTDDAAYNTADKLNELVDLTAQYIPNFYVAQRHL